MEKTPTQSSTTSETSSILSLRLVRNESGLMLNRSYRIDKSRIVIGSVISSDVLIESESVAPIHAVIEIKKDESGHIQDVQIYDLASQTGVWVNGEKLIRAHLNVGDVFTVGECDFEVEFEKIVHGTGLDELMRIAEGRKLFIDPEERLSEFVLESSDNEDKLYSRKAQEGQALEVVMSWCGSILSVDHLVFDEYDREVKYLFGITRNEKFLEKHEGKFFLYLHPEMNGVIQSQGSMRNLDEIRDTEIPEREGLRLPVAPPDFAKISLGDVDYYLSFTAAPPKTDRASLFDSDRLFWKIFTSSLALTALIVAALLNLKVSKNVEPERLPPRIAKILYQPEIYTLDFAKLKRGKGDPGGSEQGTTDEGRNKLERGNTKKFVPKLTETSSDQLQKQGEGKGQRAQGPAGKRGKPETKVTQSKPSTDHKKSGGKTGEARGRQKAVGQKAGGLKFLEDAKQSFLDILKDTSSQLGKSGKKLEGVGGFSGGGEEGLSDTGFKQGGGDITDGKGLSDSVGEGAGRVRTGLGAEGTGTEIAGGKSQIVLRTGGPEETVIQGSIDADKIEAAILAHLDQFRFCYEREINAGKPNLAGRVSTSFLIGASGRVTDASVVSSSLDSPNTENCILTVIKRIPFPKPKGNGVVQVKYPFKFRPINR